MKTRILLTVLMIGMIMGAYAQKPTITLTFTADNNGQHVPLNSILIENLTQGGDTTLYAPDTVLVQDYVTGIREDNKIGDNVFCVSQNYPNPMKDKTTIDLYLPRAENVIITVSDIMGRELIHREYRLNRGIHSFAFFPGSESLYFLTARIDGQSETIKMFNSPSHASTSGICKLEYNGAQAGINKYKSGNNLNNFIFSLGDQLKYISFTALGNRTIIDSPTGDQTYTFQYASGIPCPGIPTITDIDGNTYNTALVGDQCWMKENLKTTTYNNGASIPNVTDANTWSNLTSGAYVWYDNDISWKDSYGALYNWFTTVDTNGLCPTGWHLPTNDEWTALTDFIGGTISPYGNELKSCRQVNSPLGGGCNTSEHPRWEEDINYGNYGTDDYGFSGLPGGYRHDFGAFNDRGDYGSWWSSTPVPVSGANNGFGLYYDGGFANPISAPRTYGYSVRCLRDKIPTVTTAGITNITQTTATSGGEVTNDGGFDITARGVCWSTAEDPTIDDNHTNDGTGIGTFVSELTGLTPDTSYVVRAYATNSEGTAYGSQVYFIAGCGQPCPETPTITYEGQTYNTVQIDDQCWFKENLNVGTMIPGSQEMTNNSIIQKYCYEDNPANCATYGGLYQWNEMMQYTLQQGTQGIYPTGWHLPTDEEWCALTQFIDPTVDCNTVGYNGTDVGTKMKSTTGWYGGGNGTNASGFTALPGGYRFVSGYFLGLGDGALFWSSTVYDASYAWYWGLNNDFAGVDRGYTFKYYGSSSRCVKD